MNFRSIAATFLISLWTCSLALGADDAQAIPFILFPESVERAGGTLNAFLVSGLGLDSTGIALSGSDLFVTTQKADTIGEYTTSGGTVNASLVSGLSGPCTAYEILNEL